MARSTFFAMLFIGLIAANGAWGRGEFRIGGPEGNSWQALAEAEAGSFAIVAADGSVIQTEPVEPVSYNPAADDQIKDSSEIVMIDFGDNGLQPVWISPEENLALSIAGRGGLINTSVGTGYTGQTGKSVQPVVDGDNTTAFFRPVDISPRLNGINIAWVKNLVLSLGAELPVNRVRFFPRPEFEENFLAWYELGGVPGDSPIVDEPGQTRPGKRWFRDISRSLESSNDPAIQILRRETENLDVDEDVRFDTQDLRWITLRPLDPERNWEVAELEVYGEGFVTRTAYRTNILDFGRPVTWSKIRWQGELPERTRVALRTRTGNSPQPFRYLKVDRTGRFDEVDRKTYNNTYSSQSRSANKVKKQLDQENWSFWSPAYEWETGLRDESAATWADGTLLLSPSPTRYLQIEVLFFSDRDVAPRIDQLEILLSETSAASQVVGEIWPVETENFRPQTFTYVVRPVLGAADGGFDRLEVITHTRASAVHSVLVDGAEMSDRFAPEIQDDRIILSFDKMEGPQDSEKRIEVVFDARVLRFGSDFTGLIWSSDEPAIKQQIEPGNATFRFGGDVLSVRTPMGGELISQATAVPQTFTPNGDGVNDQVQIVYDVRDLAAQRTHVLEILDLSGRLVRRLAKAPAASGTFAQVWDGRDERGGRVAPGIYLLRIEVDVDQGSNVVTGVLAVAY